MKVDSDFKNEMFKNIILPQIIQELVMEQGVSFIFSIL